MKKRSTSKKSQTDWKRLKAMKEKDIDLSDNPEITLEMFARAIVRQGLLPVVRTFATILLLGIGFTMSAHAQSADEINAQAKEQLTRGNFEAAMPLLRKAAELGHPEAQYNLGIAFLGGEGVAKDEVQGISWLKKSAAQQNVNAQYMVARCYAKGYGVASDMKQALEWYLKAAENNDVEAQLVVVGLYLNGSGTDTNLTEALNWAERLALQENPNDLRISGKITSARLNLAQMYLNGLRGVAIDSLQAYKWFLIANENKVDMSVLVQQQIVKEVQSLQNSMTSEEQVKAQQMAETTFGRPLRNLANLLKEEY
jgi:uncharacterized protein